MLWVCGKGAIEKSSRKNITYKYFMRWLLGLPVCLILIPVDTNTQEPQADTHAHKHTHTLSPVGFHKILFWIQWFYSRKLGMESAFDKESYWIPGRWERALQGRRALQVGSNYVSSLPFVASTSSWHIGLHFKLSPFILMTVYSCYLLKYYENNDFRSSCG